MFLVVQKPCRAASCFFHRKSQVIQLKLKTFGFSQLRGTVLLGDTRLCNDVQCNSPYCTELKISLLHYTA